MNYNNETSRFMTAFHLLHPALWDKRRNSEIDWTQTRHEIMHCGIYVPCIVGFVGESIEFLIDRIDA